MVANPTTPDPSPDHAPAEPARATTLLLTGVIAIAAVGFVVGTVGSGTRSPITPNRGVTITSSPPDGTHPAVTYAEMGTLDLGPNRAWKTRLEDLVRPPIDLFAAAPVDRDAKLASLETRASRRAYNGAPPVIPHKVDQVSTASCLQCHELALAVGATGGGKIPHPPLASCTQCHVEQASAALPPFMLAENDFRGLAAPFEAPRAGPGAPPIIPHSTLMRTDCLSCHGPGGANGLQTPHPWQQACLQCHAPSAILDQYASEERPAFLPGPVIQSK